MTRPIYETEADRQRELSVADMVAVFIGGRMIKTRNMSCADYLIQDMKGVMSGLLEIKVRRYTPEEMDTLGGFFLSEKKLILIYEVVTSLKLDFHLVVKTPNCLLHLRFDHDKPWPRLERKFGGRFDRSDSKDAEILCLFPTTMFTRINDDPAPVSASST